MKKFLLLGLFGAMLASCEKTEMNEIPDIPTSGMKASEVFVYSGGDRINKTRAIDWHSEKGYSIPDNGRYLVYYYIRIDGKIPGEDETNLKAGDYFPRTSAKKTMVSDLNHGYVTANAEWRSGKFSKYIYSTDGSAVQSIILEEPTIEDLVNANQYAADDFSGYLKHQDELHFIWYICKQQGPSDHTWHIDGILTKKDRSDISETDYGKEILEKYEEYGMVKDYGDVRIKKGHVEVDVHQQEHKDWNEIKTSIHLRDTVVTEVFLPIDYVAQADDFDIRVGKDYDYITELENCKIQIGEETFEMAVSIKHEPEGIRITIQPNKDALKAAREYYADGITFEVHSYVTNAIPNDVIWQKLKATTCTTSPSTDVFGQITSAYYEDEVKF